MCRVFFVVGALLSSGSESSKTLAYPCLCRFFVVVGLKTDFLVQDILILPAFVLAAYTP